MLHNLAWLLEGLGIFFNPFSHPLKIINTTIAYIKHPLLIWLKLKIYPCGTCIMVDINWGGDKASKKFFGVKIWTLTSLARMELEQEIEHKTSNMSFTSLILSLKGIKPFATNNSMTRCYKWLHN